MRWSKRQIQKRIQAAVALLAAWLVLLSVASETSAALYQWNGSVDSNWRTAANWNGGQVPDFNGSFVHRLNVNGSQELVYDASLGTTVYDGSVGSGGRGLVIGSSTGDGTMRITGGTFSTSGATGTDVVGNSDYTGILIIDGGNYINSAGFDFGTGGTGTGSLVINSGSATITALQMKATTASIDLNGGTLQVNSISRVNGTGTFSFNGGTLRAGANSETFMQGLSRANIRNGGALVDTNGHEWIRHHHRPGPSAFEYRW